MNTLYLMHMQNYVYNILAKEPWVAEPWVPRLGVFYWPNSPTEFATSQLQTTNKYNNYDAV